MSRILSALALAAIVLCVSSPGYAQIASGTTTDGAAVENVSLALTAVATNVVSGDTVNLPYVGLRLDHSVTNVKVNIQSSQCRMLNNNSSNDYFVPARTMMEWTAFLQNLPVGVTISDCSGTPTLPVVTVASSEPSDPGMPSCHH